MNFLNLDGPRELDLMRKVKKQFFILFTYKIFEHNASNFAQVYLIALRCLFRFTTAYNIL